MNPEKYLKTPLSTISLVDVKINGPFWKDRVHVMATSTLPAQHEQLCLHHHLDNFRAAAGSQAVPWSGIFYYDSDLYKWIEACSYALQVHPSDYLEKRVDEAVQLIIEAQMDDGYVNTFMSVNHPQHRLHRFNILHELYCAGHLIEAAVARAIVSGREDLLTCALRFVDLLAGKREIFKKGVYVPGHQELELALFRLQSITGNPSHGELATHFLNNRGTGRCANWRRVRDAIHGFRLIRKANKRTRAFIKENPSFIMPDDGKETSTSTASPRDYFRMAHEYISGKYNQQHDMFLEREEPVGHAVREMYYLAAWTELFMRSGDPAVLERLEATWDAMVHHKMYITGGIGSVPLIEGFGRKNELPNKRAYCETCAAIGNLLWNWRMWLATGNKKYGDLMELVLYNAFLVGWSLDGEAYSYSNPLESDGSPRKAWFPTACCPPNIARLVCSLGNFIVARSEHTLLVNQFVGCTVSFGNDCILSIEASLPWDSRVVLSCTKIPGWLKEISVRIPAWIDANEGDMEGTIASNGIVNDGYISFTTMPGSSFNQKVRLPMSPRYINGNPAVKENRNKVAIRRGPLIYCMEGIDNPGLNLERVRIDPSQPINVCREHEDLPGISRLQGACSTGENGSRVFIAIPYFAWGNRGISAMKVWIPSL
ncbi:hypothetical protein GF325_01020 [Candidatus Bathyarchaeota archaeon]|nr:hypothetical protein [Candidatus Bathyarchaeota archaeon]